MRVLRLHLVHLTGTGKKKPSSTLGFFVLAHHEQFSFELRACLPAGSLRIDKPSKNRTAIISFSILFRIETRLGNAFRFESKHGFAILLLQNRFDSKQNVLAAIGRILQTKRGPLGGERGDEPVVRLQHAVLCSFVESTMIHVTRPRPGPRRWTHQEFAEPTLPALQATPGASFRRLPCRRRAICR